MRRCRHTCRCLLFVLIAAVFAVAAADPRPVKARPLPADQLVSPPVPAIRPTIVHPASMDADHDKVDDLIATTLAAAADAGDQAIRIECIFAEPITQKQIDAFLAAGGQLEYIYKYLSHGWNGVIARRAAANLPAVLGDRLVAVSAFTVRNATPMALTLRCGNR